jgi:hypothetical protein
MRWSHRLQFICLFSLRDWAKSFRPCVVGVTKMFNPFISEIKISRPLQIFGFMLSLSLLLTAYFWQSSGQLAGVFSPEGPVICWPFFASCETTRSILGDYHRVLTASLGVLSLGAALTFLYARVSIAWALLFLAFILKIFIFVHDYQLMGNYHYMGFVTIFFFLFIPDRVNSIAWLLPIFYVSAGLLKLNPEWLSSANLLSESWIPKPLLYPSLMFALILELVLVPLLLAVPFRSRTWWFVILNLIAFHAISWHIVGYFYPLTMACILSFYFLVQPQPRNLRNAIAIVALVAVAIPQLTRTFLFPDSSVEGTGRLWALNMLDGMPICNSHFVIRSPRLNVVASPEMGPLAPRIRCDPIVFAATVKDICKRNYSEGPFDLDLFVETRMTTSEKFVPTIAIRDACSRPVRLNIFGEIVQ